MPTLFNSAKDCGRVLVIGDIKIANGDTESSSPGNGIDLMTSTDKSANKALINSLKKVADSNLIVGRFLKDKTFTHNGKTISVGWMVVSSDWIQREILCHKEETIGITGLKNVLKKIKQGDLSGLKLQKTNTGAQCRLRMLDADYPDKYQEQEGVATESTSSSVPNATENGSLDVRNDLQVTTTERNYILSSMRTHGRKIFHWSRSFVSNINSVIKWAEKLKTAFSKNAKSIKDTINGWNTETFTEDKLNSITDPKSKNEVKGILNTLTTFIERDASTGKLILDNFVKLNFDDRPALEIYNRWTRILTYYNKAYFRLIRIAEKYDFEAS